MKKGILLLTMTLASIMTLAQSYIGLGQEDLQDLSEKYQFLPKTFTNAKVQIMVSDSEMVAEGINPGARISGLQWKVTIDTSADTTVYDLYFGDDYMFDTMPSGGVFANTPLTLVGSGLEDTGKYVGFHTAMFDSPVIWDGTDNVVIQVCRAGYNFGKSDQVSIYDSPYGNVMVSGYSHQCSATSGYYSQSRRPYLRFIIENDVQAPTVSCISDQMVAVDANCEFSIPNYADSVSASDNFTAAPTITQSIAPGTKINSDTVIWLIAEDFAGLKDTCSFSITLMDNTAPVPDQSTLSDVVVCDSVTISDIPQATDACDGVIAATTDDTLFYDVPGDYVINWNYQDGSGNLSTQQQNVSVLGELDNSVNSSGATLTANASGVSYQWINCSDNSLISGATAKAYEATENGNYAVILTKGNCIDTSVCVSVTSAGIKDGTNAIHEFVTVYPNPSSGKLSVDILENGNTFDFKVINQLGQKVYSEKSVSKHTELQLNKGIYYLILVNNEQSSFHKVVVK